MSEASLANRSWSMSTWLSVASLAFGSFAVVSSELLPMGLLTPLARDIGVSEGAAGQAITLTAIFAGVAAPTVALVIGRIDRRLITLALCALVIVSNIAAALAWNYWGPRRARGASHRAPRAASAPPHPPSAARSSTLRVHSGQASPRWGEVQQTIVPTCWLMEAER